MSNFLSTTISLCCFLLYCVVLYTDSHSPHIMFIYLSNYICTNYMLFLSFSTAVMLCIFSINFIFSVNKEKYLLVLFKWLNIVPQIYNFGCGSCLLSIIFMCVQW